MDGRLRSFSADSESLYQASYNQGKRVLRTSDPLDALRIAAPYHHGRA
jgi:hypothetical protein